VTDEPLRLLLVTHRALEDGYVAPYLHAIANRFDVTSIHVEDGWPHSASEFTGDPRFDACMWFVKFRDLAAQPAFDWASFDGLRVLLDHDAYLSYGTMARPSPYLGKWPEVFRRHRFDVLLASGKHVTELLVDDGVDAVWIPKGFDDTRLHDLGLPRAGICTFGTDYASRQIALARLQHAHEPVERFRCSFEELNATLNRYAASVVCNLSAFWRAPFRADSLPGRTIAKYAPNVGFRLGPGLEPMIKNFEVAGAGCAPIADWIPELRDLGFEDGATVVAYHDADELVERVRHFRTRPDELVAIGRDAARLCRARHTWDHRAEQMEAVLRGRL
jgi:hypothetical protein